MHRTYDMHMRHIDGNGLTILLSTYACMWEEKPRLALLWLKTSASFNKIAKLRSLTLEGAVILHLELADIR